MLCQECSSDNREGRRYCRACGALLPGVCPACAFANDDGDAFCGGCGAGLTSAPATRKSSAERRHLTVMFCDLVGSTALSDGMDPEEFSTVVAAFRDACVGEIKALDGFVARHMGDGMLVYFGYPHAHENDALRAVRCGLAIVAAVARLDYPISVRVGIASGRVVVGDVIGEGASQEAAVLGDTPNLAARLQGVAEPGCVMISPSTHALVSVAMQCRGLGDKPLKGFKKQIEPFLVLGERAPEDTRFRTPLAGREAELAHLDVLWRKAASGTGQVVLLSADMGMGKSHLVQEAARRIEGAHATHSMLTCSSFHTQSAFHPFSPWITQAAGANVEDYVSNLDGETAVNAHALSLLAPGLSTTHFATSDLKAETLQHALFDTLTAMVAARCKDGPHLMIFEDVQWADPSTRTFLQLLVEALAALPVLLVLTHRSDIEPPLSIGGIVHAITLGSLDHTACHALILGITGGNIFAKTVSDMLIRKTDGVPLYLETLAKTVLETGLSKGKEAVSIPESLHDSLMARLDRMGEAKHVAQCAAVIGRTFELGVLKASLPAEIGDLDGKLHTLEDADMLFRRGAGASETFVFKHALVQEMAYRSLLKQTRRTYHRTVADALQTRFQTIVADEPERLAFHLTHAGDYAGAIEYWRIAGKRASARWANVEVRSHLENAVDLLAELPMDAARIAQEISVRLDLAGALRILDLNGEAFAVLDVADRLADDAKRLDARATILNLRGNLHFASGALEACLDAHTQALACARHAKEVVAEIKALSGMADAQFLFGRMASAERRYDQCIRLGVEKDKPWALITNLALRGHMRLYLDRLDEAAADCREAIRLAEADGNRRAAMVARGSCLAKILCEQKDGDAARTQLEQSLEICRHLGAKRFEPLYETFLARALALQGDDDQARIMADSAIAKSAAMDHVFVGPMVFGTAALVTQDTRYLAQGEHVLTAQSPAHNHLWFYRDAIVVSTRNGDTDAAARYASALTSFTNGEPLAWCARYISSAQAQQPSR